VVWTQTAPVSRYDVEQLRIARTIMKVTTTTLLTMDGVMQGPGSVDEDRRGGFERGGWAMGDGDSSVSDFIAEIYQRADGFLFGRVTYENFAGYWGVMQSGAHPIGDALNARPKYVASNTLASLSWANTTVLSGDVAAAVRELRAAPGGELQVHGSGQLVRSLLSNQVVDEMTFIIVPRVVGQGTHLFPDNGPNVKFNLVASRHFQDVVVQTYRSVEA